MLKTVIKLYQKIEDIKHRTIDSEGRFFANAKESLNLYKYIN